MSARLRTNLLALLVIVASVCAFVARGHLADAWDAAAASDGELREGRAALAELTSTGGERIAATSPSEQQLDQLINAAADDAGAQISSIEPGPIDGQSATGYTETAVFLRIDSLTMRQLVTMLHTLARRDAAVRARSIEFSAPQAADAASDAWAADVTISYKSFSSGKAK